MKKFFVKIILIGLSPILFSMAIFAMTQVRIFYIDSVDEKFGILLARYPSEKLEIIIAGDSRAKYHLIPEVFEDRLNMPTINLAGAACSLTQAYDNFKRKRLLDHNYIVLLGTTAFHINDKVGGRGYLPAALLLHISLSEQLALYKNDIFKLLGTYSFAVTEWVDIFVRRTAYARDIMLGAEKNDVFLSRKGYTPAEGELRPMDFADQTEMIKDNFYKNIQMNNIKWKVFQKSMRDFSKSKCTLIIYQSPIAPTVKKYGQDSLIQTVESTFSKMLSEEVKKYSNVFFFDFYTNPSDQLTDSMFQDALHLNEKGAEIFSNLVIEELFKRGVLKSRTLVQAKN